MQVSIDSQRVIRQFGKGLGELDGCTTTEVDSALLDVALRRPHDSLTLNLDGSITVLYDAAAHDQAEQARIQAEANKTAALALVKDKSKSPTARLDALIQALGL